MKILLIAPVKDRYVMGLAKYPPVGLGYLATAVRKRGHEVRILDCVRQLIDLDAFTDCIKSQEFDVAGFTLWSLALKEVKESLKIIKQLKPQAVTILGGPHPSALPLETVDFFPEADFAFRGEGEIGFPAFLDCLGGKKTDFSSVPGLIWRSSDGVKVNEPLLSQDLDSLGYPSWDLINPPDYFMPGTLIGKDTAVLTCTRGCPFHCTFCSAWITAGRTIRRRSIKGILDEIEYLNKNFGIKIFDIPDENFTFDKEYVKSFCQAVIDK